MRPWRVATRKTPAKKKPRFRTVIFTVREWPLAAALHRAFGFPDGLLDLATCFDPGRAPSPSIWEDRPEPPLPMSHEGWEDWLRGMSRLGHSVFADPLGAHFHGDATTQAHNSATLAELEASLVADGREVVRLGDELARRLAPDTVGPRERAAMRARILSDEDRAALEAGVAGGAYREELERARSLLAWLDSGEGTPSLEALQRVEHRLPELPQAVETWGPFEARLCAACARLTAGRDATGDENDHALDLLTRVLRKEEGIVDRFGLLRAHLVAAGLDEVDILRVAFGDPYMSPTTSGEAYLLAADRASLFAAGPRVRTASGPGTWFDVLVAAAIGAGEGGMASQIRLRELGAELERDPSLASCQGYLALIEADAAHASLAARGLLHHLEHRTDDPSGLFELARKLHQTDKRAHAELYARGLEAALGKVPDAFGAACSHRPRAAMAWLADELRGRRKDAEVCAAMLRDAGKLVKKPTPAELDAFAAILGAESDPRRGRPLAAFLQKHGRKVAMKAPPGDVTGVDATGNVALDSALVRVFDPAVHDASGASLGDLLKLATSGAGVAFSTTSDGVFRVHVTGKDEALESPWTYGLEVTSGEVEVAGEGGGFTFAIPAGHYRATVVAVAGEEVDYRVYLSAGEFAAREVKDFDRIEPAS